MFREQESPSVWKKEIGKKTRRILPQATCIIQDRAIEFRSFRNLRNLPGVTGSRDTQREEEPILTSRDTTRSMSLRGNERENESNLMIARWIYGEMMDCGRRVGRRRGRVCVVSIPRSGPASIDHLGLL